SAPPQAHTPKKAPPSRKDWEVRDAASSSGPFPGMHRRSAERPPTETTVLPLRPKTAFPATAVRFRTIRPRERPSNHRRRISPPPPRPDAGPAREDPPRKSPPVPRPPAGRGRRSGGILARGRFPSGGRASDSSASSSPPPSPGGSAPAPRRTKRRRNPPPPADRPFPPNGESPFGGTFRGNRHRCR